MAPSPIHTPATPGAPRMYELTASIMNITAHRSQDVNPTSRTVGAKASTAGFEGCRPDSEATVVIVTTHTSAVRKTVRSRTVSGVISKPKASASPAVIQPRTEVNIPTTIG